MTYYLHRLSNRKHLTIRMAFSSGGCNVYKPKLNIPLNSSLKCIVQWAIAVTVARSNNFNPISNVYVQVPNSKLSISFQVAVFDERNFVELQCFDHAESLVKLKIFCVVCSDWLIFHTTNQKLQAAK